MAALKDPRIDYITDQVLERVQFWIYLAVTAFLVIMALIAFYIVAIDLLNLIMHSPSIIGIDNALEDLLVILIIAALIQTLIEYIKSGQLDPRLILSVGLTAVIRRVLVFGANQRPWEDIVLTALLLLVLIIGIYLIGDKKFTHEK
ncbi:phosphate-starvation-inducible E [Methanocella sp. CWC-04]|uniref:Phosphate-starvation-inducible E n=1 Tax=Methanooceanicella nereidis TaxID=2052831 RepID=A0AAP2W627_9EURY|nr:phosphate-starvation-inducible PsiE family protein [Methanocella sp. CWC-04]MCD1293666.1 phosphate-starvation-inducible E [Methanocella sp. CWC-04]